MSADGVPSVPVMLLEPDEWRRVMLIEHCASFCSIDELERLFQWMKNGLVETKPALKTVK